MFNLLKRVTRSVDFENIVYVENVPISNNTPTTVNQEKAEPRVTVKSYFAERGITVDFSHEKTTIPAVQELAIFIATGFQETQCFIKFLRERLSCKKYSFTYSMSTLGSGTKKKVVELAAKMYEYGLLNSYHYDPANCRILGTVSGIPRCVNFINGDFLEMYASSTISRIVKEKAVQYNCDSEVYSNVIIEKEGKKNELDVVFRVGKNVFWSEVKSGQFSAEDYHKLGKQMGVVPDKLILLAADRKGPEAKAITYFYEYYCANVMMFESWLIRMIDSAFKGDEAVVA